MPDTTRTRAALPALLISLVPALAIALDGLWRATDGSRRASLFDDAMISMSYARTLAGGDGLVWYPGAPEVEGVTNLAWTGVMALLHLTGLPGSAIAVTVMALGLACAWAASLVGLHLVRDLLPPSRAATFGVTLVVAANLPLLFWAVRGMEVGPVVLLTLAACALTRSIAVGEGDGRRSAALLAVCTLGIATRSDFALVPAALGVWALITPVARRGRLLGLLAAAVVMPLAAVTAFRWGYYGELLPNTYHLKLGGVPIGTRLERGTAVAVMTAGAYLLPALVVTAVAWAHLDEVQRQLGRLLLLVAAAQVAYSTYVGGDAWELYLIPNRYLTPAVVCLWLLAAAATFAAWSRVGSDGEARAALLRRWAVAAVVIGLGPALTVVANRLVGDPASMQPGALAGLHPEWEPSLVVVPILCASAGVVAAALLLWTPGTGSRVAHGAAPLVVVVLSVVPLYFRAPQIDIEDGNVFSELGDQLALVTTPAATVAVSGAGGSQYWADRPAVDLLGKSDAHVARLDPTAPFFVPGHDKMDVAHSVGALRPDVVAQSVPGEVLLGYGYVPVQLLEGSFREAIPWQGDTVVFVLPDSPHVRWDRVRQLPA